MGKKKKHEISDLDVFEVSFVENPANRRKFLMFKEEKQKGSVHIMTQDKVWKKIKKEAKEVYPTETESVAVTKMLENNPNLYNEYLDASPKAEISEVKKDEIQSEADQVLERLALQLIKENPDLTFDQAFRKVFDENPGIVEATFR